MNINEEAIKLQWVEVDNDSFKKALLYLKQCEKDVHEFLADCVASVCEVDVDVMLSDTNASNVAHARWLFWYAYRYLTNESYEVIARSTARNGKTFALRSVQNGVTKMTMLINDIPFWKKKWNLVKRIIKLRDGDREKQDNTIVIAIPKELKEKIKIEIKDK